MLLPLVPPIVLPFISPPPPPPPPLDPAARPAAQTRACQGLARGCRSLLQASPWGAASPSTPAWQTPRQAAGCSGARVGRQAGGRACLWWAGSMGHRCWRGRRTALTQGQGRAGPGGCARLPWSHVATPAAAPPPSPRCPPPLTPTHPTPPHPTPSHSCPRGRGAVLLAPMLSLEKVSRKGLNPYIRPLAKLLSALVPSAAIVATERNTLYPAIQVREGGEMVWQRGSGSEGRAAVAVEHTNPGLTAVTVTHCACDPAASCLQAQWDADPLACHISTRVRNADQYLRATEASMKVGWAGLGWAGWVGGWVGRWGGWWCGVCVGCGGWAQNMRTAGGRCDPPDGGAKGGRWMPMPAVLSAPFPHAAALRDDAPPPPAAPGGGHLSLHRLPL